MERFIRELTHNFGKLDAHLIRLILVLITLILFVLGAGAPASMGGIGG